MNPSYWWSDRLGRELFPQERVGTIAREGLLIYLCDKARSRYDASADPSLDGKVVPQEIYDFIAFVVSHQSYTFEQQQPMTGEQVREFHRQRMAESEMDAHRSIRDHHMYSNFCDL